MKRIVTLLLAVFSVLGGKAQDSDKSFLEEYVYPEFLRYEATYRNQKVQLPRSSIAQPLTLGAQLTSVLGNTSDFTDAYVCVGTWGGMEDTLYVNPKTLFDMDPIMLAYDVKNGQMVKKYEEPNVTINLGYMANDSTKRYMTLFMSVRGFLDREMYSRMTIMYPGKEADDMTTYSSPSAPFVGSYITAFDANMSNVAEDMKFYESVDSSVKTKIKSKEEFSFLEYKLIEGILEKSMEAYDDSYAISLYNDKRYNDAYHFFEKAYLANRADMLCGNYDNKDLYYKACFYMGNCLNKLGVADKAMYFLGLAALNGGEYAQAYTKLEEEKVSKQELHNFQFTNENKYDLNSITAGQILRCLYDIVPEYILGGKVKVNDNSTTRTLSSSDAWDLDLKSLCTDRPSVLILQYSKAQSETQSTVDQSKLLSDNSIILTVYKASNKPDLWRVNIMIPNFRYDDDKKGSSELNKPLMSSFIISNERNQWDMNNYESIIDKCCSLIHSNKCAEAMTGLKLVYCGLKQKFEGRFMPSVQKKLYQTAGYWYGYSLIELDAAYKAISYLQPNAEVGSPREKEEYINALCGIQDIRTIDLIDQELSSVNTHLKKNSKDEDYKEYRNFLQRRKAYILIDQKKYDEAETILNLQKKLEKDPKKLEIVENELKYIQEVKGNE